MADTKKKTADPSPEDEKPPADTAPSGKGSTGGGGKKSSGGRKKKVKKEDLEAVLGVIGSGVWLVNAYDGERILTHTGDVADALIKMQDQNDQVRRALLAMVTTSTWGAVASAFLPMIMPILANHRVVPVNVCALPGVNAPMPPWAANGQTSGQGPAIDLDALRNARNSGGGDDAA